MTETIKENLSIGELLVKKRKELNLTPEHFQKSSRIIIRYILALENDVFKHDDLSATYVRAHLRDYCRFLKITEEEKLAAIKETVERYPDCAPILEYKTEETNDGVSGAAIAGATEAKENTPEYSLNKQHPVTNVKKDNTIRLIFSLVIAAVVIIIIIFSILERGNNVKDVAANDATTMNHKKELEDKLAAQKKLLEEKIQVEKQLAEQQKIEEERAAREAAKEAERLKSEQEKAEKEQAEKAKANQEGTTPVADINKGLYITVIGEEAWIEISDINGKYLVAKLLQKGETLHLKDSTYYKVVLGNGKAVTVNYNGKPYAYYIQKNLISRFTIDE